ncbi:MAG TPA: hypothetical protein VFZ34_04735 [Blastocatellia bacterium]|nr:hypothetical protein [Blastocatellia bacterium]
MKFIRRPDLDKVTRTTIAVQAFLGQGVYGEITRLAQCYRVSRLFVYTLLWQLSDLFAAPCAAVAPRPASYTQREVDQHILLLRLVGHCSLESLAQIGAELGLPSHSVGYLSQRVTTFARALPPELPTGGPRMVLLADEIFAAGQPILLTVEPRSLAILKIELAPDREATTWQQHWAELVSAGLLEQVVSDRGTGLVKGCALLGLTHHPDLFHLLRPLALFGARFYRQALAAIEHEYERGALALGSTPAVIERRRADYEAARVAAVAKIARYDNFGYLWGELRRLLEAFDAQGQLPDLAQRQAEIRTVLALLGTLESDALQAEVKSFASGLAGYWGYYERLAVVYEDLCAQHARPVVAALACGWQWERQATNSKEYGVRQRLHQAAQAAYDEAARLLPEGAVARQQAVVAALSAEVRSSSLIENVNSALRPLLATSRGQVRQETLDLFAYVHNHRRFVRGQRAGRAPLEILTGQALEQSWLEALLALV